MELTPELKSKTADELESWCLEEMGKETGSAEMMFLALERLRAGGRVNATDEMAGMFQQVLIERKEKASALALLERRARWHAGDARFRETWRRDASDIMDSRLGAGYVKSVGFDGNLPPEECVRRLLLLDRLQPGALCEDKTWGFGVVSRLDDFYQKIVIDFDGKPGHPMSFAYAAETLSVVGPEHLLARRRANPEAVAELVRTNPAEVVRLALTSFGPLSAPRLKDALVGQILTEAEWKPFWDAARKVLKNDPLVELPSKRNDPILLLDVKKEYDAGWFAALQGERDLDAIWARLADMEQSVDVRALGPDAVGAVADRLAYTLRAIENSKPERALQVVMMVGRFGLADPGGVWRAGAMQLMTPRLLAVALAGLPAREIGDAMVFLGAVDGERLNASLIELLPRLPLPVLTEAIAHLEGAGRHDACAERLRGPLTAREPSMSLLCWLAKNPERIESWSLLKRHDFLVQAVVSMAQRAAGAELRAQNQLRELLEDREWLGALLGGIEGWQREDFLRRVQDARGWEETARRSVLAKLIKLFPELQRIVSGGRDDRAAAAPAKRFTSWRRYKERQTAFRKLVEEEIPQNSRDIATARSYGDLRENFEYTAAKQQQTLLMQRQAEMEEDLRVVSATDFSGMNVDGVGMGACVTLDLAAGGTRRFCILGEWDSDEALGIVSSLSQVARTLEGKQVGDRVELPGGDTATVASVEGLPADVHAWIRG